MFKKLKEAADARRSEAPEMTDLRERVAELLSPKMAALVAASLAHRAAEEGLVCELGVELGASSPFGEMTLGFTLDPSKLTAQAAAELEATKPAPPAGLAPLVQRIEETSQGLIRDLGRRLALLQKSSDLFSTVEVSATLQIDVQIASIWLTVTASQPEG